MEMKTAHHQTWNHVTISAISHPVLVMELHCLFTYTTVKYMSQINVEYLTERHKPGKATYPDLYSFCAFSSIIKSMNWEYGFTISIDDHNLLISVKFFLPCHR